MKKLLVLVAFLFVFAGSASAHEGLVDLTGGTVSCKGVSVYQDSNYRVSGRCDGLVYPYETTYNKYVLWGKASDGGQMTRIAEVDRGYFSGIIPVAFDAMYITAEQDGLVRKPSNKMIVSGMISTFDFDKSKVTTIPASTTGTTTTATTVKPATVTSSTAGAVVGKIVSSLLVVILVIVGLAIGASLLFRSRGSVSA